MSHVDMPLPPAVQNNVTAPLGHSSTHNAIVIRVRGQVQGVGFRPFIWQLAQQFALKGHVLNDSDGVLITLLQPLDLDRFLTQLETQLPPLARIDSISVSDTQLESPPQTFTIARSQHGGGSTQIAPDQATCSTCLAEMNQPQDRRYRYPFINCTHCGPRISIIEQVPYDRPYTSMAAFKLCPACQQEYDNPADRRFHAQPIACAVCGPRLSWCLADGVERCHSEAALQQAITALAQGKIVAIKALGGYHLAVDATAAHAVRCLRQRKQRPTKPLAVMVADLAMAHTLAHISPLEAEQLQSNAAPIVLLSAKANNGLAPQIAPNVAELGLMLPSNPLQHLLLQALNRPLVMTSANASGLPPCIDDQQALTELATIADGWLGHNRPIVNRMDDSIVRVINEQPQLLRRARGFVPSPIPLPAGFERADQVLAYGSDLKNSFAFLRHGHAILSPHLGDLANPALHQTYQTLLAQFPTRFDFQVAVRACDAHPAYFSSQLAAQYTDTPLLTIDHHHAHVAACLVDNSHGLHEGPVLALVLDGLGWGGADTEHSLWGGEILLADHQHCQHLDGLPAVALIGADLAAKQPWRNLLAHLDQAVANWQNIDLAQLDQLQVKPLSLLRQAAANGINCPLASSAGRLFDAVAALLIDIDLNQSFEGEAAMRLESLAWQAVKTHGMPSLSAAERISDSAINLSPLWQALLQGLQVGKTTAELALGFHQQLAQLWLDRLTFHCQRTGINKVALSGGVLQNRLLQHLLQTALTSVTVNEQPLTVLVHRQIPANDGGLALGQAVIAWSRAAQSDSDQSSEGR